MRDDEPQYLSPATRHTALVACWSIGFGLLVSVLTMMILSPDSTSQPMPSTTASSSAPYMPVKGFMVYVLTHEPKATGKALDHLTGMEQHGDLTELHTDWPSPSGEGVDTTHSADLLVSAWRHFHPGHGLVRVLDRGGDVMSEESY